MVNWTLVIIVGILALLSFSYAITIKFIDPCNNKNKLNETLLEFGNIAKECYDKRKNVTSFTLEDTDIKGVSEKHSGYHTVKLLVKGLLNTRTNERVSNHCVILYVDPEKKECKPIGTRISEDCTGFNFEEAIESDDNKLPIAQLKVIYQKWGVEVNLN